MHSSRKEQKKAGPIPRADLAEAISLENERAELLGNVKVTRQDWLDAAMDIFIHSGVGDVKILTLSDKLNVSRSSFYWYFSNRKDLLDALLEYWEETNTKALLRAAEAPANSIAQAVCNVFCGFIDPAQFDTKLDFAVKDWARRSEDVKKVHTRSDNARLHALQKMFMRFDYEETDALVRARILYYMQLGYNDAELNEPMEDRLALIPHYILGFTGKKGDETVLEDFREFVKQLGIS